MVPTPAIYMIDNDEDSFNETCSSNIYVGINFDCYDLARTSRSFFTKVFGIKIAFHNIEQKKTIIVCGIIEDVYLNCIQNSFIREKI